MRTYLLLTSTIALVESSWSPFNPTTWTSGSCLDYAGTARGGCMDPVCFLGMTFYLAACCARGPGQKGCEPPSAPWSPLESSTYCPQCEYWSDYNAKFPEQCKTCVSDGFLAKVFDFCPQCHRQSKFKTRFPIQCAECASDPRYCLYCQKPHYYAMFVDRCKKCSVDGEVADYEELACSKCTFSKYSIKTAKTVPFCNKYCGGAKIRKTKNDLKKNKKKKENKWQAKVRTKWNMGDQDEPQNASLKDAILL